MFRPSIRTEGREARLLYKGDIEQLLTDTLEHHVRADGVLETVGTIIMTPAVMVTKLGNAIAGEFSPREAQPLGDGALAYIERDVHSAVGNVIDVGWNLVTLHPVRAAGNAVKAAFDALDVVFVDPLLDLGSGAFGHQMRQTRAQAEGVCATAA